MAKITSTNVLIVGSGVAGGLIAEELLKQGVKDITMLEAGSNFIMGDRRVWLDVLMADKFPFENVIDTTDDYYAGGVARWEIEGGRLFARGGSTLNWGGWCPRFKPEDFELKTLTGIGMDWPFNYATLEPYYEKAEWYLQVAGDSNAQGDSPRNNPYPFEAAPYAMNDGGVIKTLEEMNISYMHLPIARNAKAIHNQPACITTGMCEAPNKYCPIGARFTGDQPLNRLAKQANFNLYLNSPVRRLLTANKSQATGVEYLDQQTGELHTIEAQHIFLCAGALETPKLLLASANQDWPKGVGNDTDLVGRYLSCDIYLFASGLKESNPNACQEELHFARLCSRYWDTPDEQAKGKFLFNNGSRGTPNLRLADMMNDKKSATEIETLIRGKQIFSVEGTMQAVYSCYENRVMLADGTTQFGLPRTRIETPKLIYSQEQANLNIQRMKDILLNMGYTLIPADCGGEGEYPQRGYHAMCTCRMSESPSEGVVDSNLKVHDMDNLYIVSNAVFSSGSAANPTLTLAALALKAVESVLEEKDL